MRRAIQLADKGAGYVSPNPLVGCVIVNKNGELIGKGYHERIGQAHAEINALDSIKDRSELVDATMYVTLEPCAHHGKTPPCADAISKLPFKRVVVALGDPNPNVNGKGIERIRKAGIQVDSGLLEEKAQAQNEVFLHWIRFGKPFVILKIAQTLDGYIAAPDGSSQWITGKESRTKVHEWRGRYDAVMVGRRTAIKDNPKLTLRHTEGRQPFRVVIDGNLELPRELNLFSDQFEEKTIVITHNEKAFNEKADPMLSLLSRDYFRGKTLLVKNRDGHSDLDQAFRQLGEAGITSVFVEAGRDLATALIRQNLVDKFHLFIAPKMLGGGTKSVQGLGLESMSQAFGLKKTSWEQTGDDLLFTGYF